ncbi:aspartate/glutamate racemase family protein [Microbulbifer hydrolyticus]|uniref:Asp/Glu/hydantoin racemase n=1 Tax=Microbulbifer hydrolyticus TaxID=48074 RepID=A0A6P1T8E7_9GAMM|nr:aspartate/glutamate racemase family protein [Microbulbifer hydrolyticus]MBB5211319.1 glutamate racemase [Microbulbifer hydrolyticus]QHQ37920.1 Asp/Glu/hydantoin racemase [Microbulbifer hydrolyticus]
MHTKPIENNGIQGGAPAIGIIAGTATDTRFGLDFLAARQVPGIGLAISASPQAQTQLQALGRDELTRQLIDAIARLENAGASAAMIYCNSLSGAVDMTAVRAAVPIPVISPLDVYAELTQRYRNFGLLAANCQSCANIEREILAGNPSAKVIGIGNLQIVEDIEDGMPASMIVQQHALDDLAAALVKSGVQILILGCTHFDYFYEELLLHCDGIRLFLPSERMLAILQERVVQAA